MIDYVRKPAWLKIRRPSGSEIEKYSAVQHALRGFNLCTVCEEAKCPNINECWGNATATFMILGDTCTRNCRFCATKTAAKGMPLNSKEPKNIANAVKKLKLRYVVITSVDRDDLQDYGAEHFRKCVEEIRKANPKVKIELLTPDFNGNRKCVDKILESKPNVFGHNIETVERLQRTTRDCRANYAQSMQILKYVKEKSPKTFTKSALLLGIGEREEEVLQALKDLKANHVDMITMGQYLQPSPNNMKVEEFVTPEKFKWYEKKAREIGFEHMASGPFVRSSYLAEKLFKGNKKTRRC